MAAPALKAVKDQPGPADIARELGPTFARRAGETTDEDRFVADNFALLKSAGLVEAGVPAELGGGGADIDELAAMLRTLAYHCGSTALAFSMTRTRWRFRPGAGSNRRRRPWSHC